ncbi:MAG: hypothetical protein HQL06_11550 [Nitrospirae bacterium]|nr:hypothetical protein [Nitrospirota bacterium]
MFERRHFFTHLIFILTIGICLATISEKHLFANEDVKSQENKSKQDSQQKINDKLKTIILQTLSSSTITKALSQENTETAPGIKDDYRKKFNEMHDIKIKTDRLLYLSYIIISVLLLVLTLLLYIIRITATCPKRNLLNNSSDKIRVRYIAVEITDDTLEQFKAGMLGEIIVEQNDSGDYLICKKDNKWELIHKNDSTWTYSYRIMFLKNIFYANTNIPEGIHGIDIEVIKPAIFVETKYKDKWKFKEKGQIEIKERI